MTESEIKAECERTYGGYTLERIERQVDGKDYDFLWCGGLVSDLVKRVRELEREPDPRDAEIARLRAEVETLTKRNRALRKNVAGLDKANRIRREVTDSVLDRAFMEQRKWLALEHRAWVWKQLAKRLRNLQREAHEAMMRNNDAWQRKYDVDVGLARKQLDGMTQVAEHRSEELRKLRDGVRRIADDFARNECDADEYNKCSWGHAAARLVALLGEE